MSSSLWMTRSAGKLTLTIIASCLFVALLQMLTGCTRSASITFLEVPAASIGGADSAGVIRGRVPGNHRGQHILLYALADSRWWVQPTASASRTEIADDGSWKAKIHLGTKYAALLTNDDSSPSPFLEALPTVGMKIQALAIVTGSENDGLLPEDSNEPTLRFSGLQWRVRTIPGSYASKTNEYSSNNAFVDDSGALHLRLSRGAHGWVCSEVHTVRSLGYGDYTLAIGDTSDLEPAVMFSAYSYFEQTSDGDHKELAIHLTRRGVASNTNAEFSIQPSFVPVNFYHFDVPSGPLKLDLNWHPDGAALSVLPGQFPAGRPVASWLFKTGVPRSDDTHLYFNFCNFGYAPTPPTHDTEVIVKSFQFYP
jgi:hypothetical protein